jgi:hypothetical protein
MKGYRTKKIALPGGRTIEIVYFYDEHDESDGATGTSDQLTAEHDSAAPASTGERTLGLHECPECEGDLVYPMKWEERGDDGWHIERRCPSCEWRHEGEFHQDEVEEFDDMLNEGTECLLTGLRNLSKSNMAADIESLIEAINEDRILPMDF